MAPPPTDPLTREAFERQVELADQQYLDHTCGERVCVETLALEHIIEPTTAAMKAEVDHLWQHVNPQVDENQWGTTVDQMAENAAEMERQYGLRFNLQPVYASGASIRSAFDSAPYTWLAESDLMGWHEYHWLLGLKDETDFRHPPHDMLAFIDSAVAIDSSSDYFPTEAVIEACVRFAGAGGHCGWAVTVT